MSTTTLPSPTVHAGARRLTACRRASRRVDEAANTPFGMDDDGDLDRRCP